MCTEQSGRASLEIYPGIRTRLNLILGKLLVLKVEKQEKHSAAPTTR